MDGDLVSVVSSGEGDLSWLCSALAADGAAGSLHWAATMCVSAIAIAGGIGKEMDGVEADAAAVRRLELLTRGYASRCFAGHDDGAGAVQTAWMWIDGRMAAIEKDDEDATVASDDRIGPIGIDHKNHRTTMHPLVFEDSADRRWRRRVPAATVVAGLRSRRIRAPCSVAELFDGLDLLCDASVVVVLARDEGYVAASAGTSRTTAIRLSSPFFWLATIARSDDRRRVVGQQPWLPSLLVTMEHRIRCSGGAL
ncbi:hypothetical protein ACLOJK_039059 [Asimina triloba]